MSQHWQQEIFFSNINKIGVRGRVNKTNQVYVVFGRCGRVCVCVFVCVVLVKDRRPAPGE